MDVRLRRHEKIHDEHGGVVEIRIWSVPISREKPEGVKYSLVYIVSGKRIVGYDNAEGKGHHRHFMDKETPYMFESAEKLMDDFYKDVTRIRKKIWEK